MSINLSTQSRPESVGTSHNGKSIVPIKSTTETSDVKTSAVGDVGQENALHGNNVPPVQDVAETEAAQQVAVSNAELSEAVSKLNAHVQQIDRQLNFTIDEELDRVVIKVLDSETKEEIRQIPSEEFLALARNFAENDNLSLLDTKA